MALIVRQDETLKNNLLITFNNASKKLSYENYDDYTVIKSDGIIVGLNIFNYHNKLDFEIAKGIHVLEKENLEKLIKKFGLKNVNLNFKMFQVGKVLSRSEHPKSKRLFVLKVKTDQEIQIVTNSLNSLVSINVVVANVGAFLPSGTKIVANEVLGIKSDGMLCGGETLNLPKTDGIITTSQKEGQEFIF